MAELQSVIESAYEKPGDNASLASDIVLKDALQAVLEGLESGKLRIAEKQNGQWQVHAWLKKAVLLYFRLYDKIPLRFTDTEANTFAGLRIRVVPPSTIRRGAFIGANSILMPSFIN